MSAEFSPVNVDPWAYLRTITRDPSSGAFPADPIWTTTQRPPEDAVHLVPKGPDANEQSDILGLPLQLIAYDAAGAIVDPTTITLIADFDFYIRQQVLNPARNPGVGGAPTKYISFLNGPTISLFPGSPVIFSGMLGGLAPAGIEVIPHFLSLTADDAAVDSFDIYVGVI